MLRALGDYLGLKLETRDNFDFLAFEVEKRLKLSDLLSKISVG
jgi:hypothetical protein